MTHHVNFAILVVLVVCLFLRAALGYARYARLRAFQAIYSKYRAAALIATSKRQLRVANLKRSVRAAAQREAVC
ncbi:hypothetical protein [Xanthomonas hortorum]|uniref:hypothetical protein n=1 Tax=Xanthomonas hortorum TaxID=56454 RepID=UPI002B259074|nr:hypothetical protein [Xanthomonas hortorum]WOB33249.1 hypothetical protein NYR96_12065 [Xanthomonas hortorum pv. pelargonii]WOB33260.1 hypothetical protein NYR96_12130 [Xanthomonas hortorum pv. pelargonii]